VTLGLTIVERGWVIAKYLPSGKSGLRRIAKISRSNDLINHTVQIT
jgi:hypothetical protein